VLGLFEYESTRGWQQCFFLIVVSGVAADVLDFLDLVSNIPGDNDVLGPLYCRVFHASGVFCVPLAAR
jgi:hypothetical protein